MTSSTATDHYFDSTAIRVSLFVVWATTAIPLLPASDKSALPASLSVLALITAISASFHPRGAHTRLTGILASANLTLCGVIAVLFADPQSAVHVALFSLFALAVQVGSGQVGPGVIGSAVTLAVAWVSWSGSPETAAHASALTISSGVPIVLSLLWLRSIALTQRRRDRAERDLLAAEEAGALQAKVRAELAAELDFVAMTALPALEPLAAGAEMTPELYVRVLQAEATLRDRIRAPQLSHPLLDATIHEARSRGVSVLRLGEPGDEPGLDEATARSISDLLRPLRSGSAIIRALPPGREQAVSLVINTEDGVVRRSFAREASA
ncbi:hypothetical protein [Microbacterium sp. RU33B]|uniref:hypothetical protein n=1 Tax=Microbacterium sp. RU33B TaxID=1907390 RepID=UPI0009772646|nr:hypothetical protein [Microbacterium sp. RU33B]